MTIKNAYTESPSNVKPGDEFLFVIKAMVLTDGEVRFYRCPWPTPTYSIDVPQGDRIYGDSILQDVFPVLASYINNVRDHE